MKYTPQGSVPSPTPALSSLPWVLTPTPNCPAQAGSLPMCSQAMDRAENQDITGHKERRGQPEAQSEEDGGVGALGPEVLTGHEDACSQLCVWPHGPPTP